MTFNHPQRVLAAILLIAFFVLLLIIPGKRD